MQKTVNPKIAHRCAMRLLAGLPLLGFGGFTAMQSSAATPSPEWQNETLLHAGTEAPFATMTIFPSEPAAHALRRENSPFYASLNGDWKIAYVTKIGRAHV